MSDSDEDALAEIPAAPRQKRFKFKTFAERVSEVRRAPPDAGSLVRCFVPSGRFPSPQVNVIAAVSPAQSCKALPARGVAPWCIGGAVCCGACGGLAPTTSSSSTD